MSQTKSGSNQRALITMVILVLMAAVALTLAYYFYQQQPQTQESVVEAPVDEPLPLPPLVQTPESLPLYEPPAPQVPAEPLPSLNESDSSVLASLQGLSTNSLKLIVPQEVLRKFVRAVNAMDEGKVVHEYRPITSPAPPLVVQPMGEPQGEEQRQYRLASENYRRYDEYVTLLAMIDPEALVAVYRRFSPLLEEAHGEMGLKKGNFHGVLLNVVDKLLAAPVVEGELLLVRPKVFYQFADPELEKLPATHKLMLRMGPENTRSLQTSLQLIRYKLAQ